MTEVKVLCGCGQKYKFDVEPANGRMPFAVNCPVCGTDGTPAANAILAQFSPVVAVPPPPPAAMRVQIAPPVQAAPPAITAAPALPIPLAAAGAVVRKAPKTPGRSSLGLGILGAFLGAGLSSGAMYGFYQWAGFRFPLLGIGVGLLTGFGARLLYKGTDISLGSISAAIAAISVVGTLYLMYGEFPLLNIISVVVSVSAAYRVASG